MDANTIKKPSDCKILIVDDEKNICDMLAETLKDDYQVEVGYSTNEAFRLIKNNSYDIVVTDLKLGDGTGIDVLRLAKELDEFVEVIIITGYGSLETASEAINSGVTSYLNKPLKINRFTQQIERAVASRLFHLKSIRLLTNLDGMPDVKDHIFDITSLYYFTSKLMYYLDVSELMKIIFDEVNEKLNAKFSVIGINYLKFSEIFAMPAKGLLSSADIMDGILTVWDESFEVFEKEDFENDQISFYVYRGRDALPGEVVDNRKYNKVISLPMTVLGETIGFIALFRDEKEPLSIERQQFFSVFTSLISSAIQHCYMDMLAKQQAKTDSLTGVANHRMFHETLEREIARAERYKRKFCLAILDIDDFKKINDTYGHLVGDGVLVDLTKRILKTIRCGDVLARYGGEEFGIILPDTEVAGAEKLANRICAIIADTPYSFSDSEISYTVSIGLVAYEVTVTRSRDELIRLADRALYQAKDEGKNRVVVNRSYET